MTHTFTASCLGKRRMRKLLTRLSRKNSFAWSERWGLIQSIFTLEGEPYVLDSITAEIFREGII